MINISFKEGNKIINLKASICKNTDIYNYMKFDYFTGLCRDGCSHYNKSHTCPQIVLSTHIIQKTMKIHY